MRLAQGLVTTADVRAFQLAAIAEIRAISDLMDAYDLSDKDRETVRAAVRKIEAYTIPMAPETSPSPSPTPPACPPSPPWWTWALAGVLGLGLGAAAVGALSD
jgi:hypothetical protein